MNRRNLNDQRLNILGRFQSVLLIFSISLNAFGQWDKPDPDFKKSKTSIFKNADYGATFMSRAFSYAEGQREAQAVQLRLVPYLSLPFHEWFEFRTRLWINVNSSRVQARFQDVSTANPLVLYESVGIFKPHDLFRLEAGAIHQRHLKAKLLIRRRTFPGVLISSTFKNESFHLTGKYQYAIPTAFSLDSDRTETEPLPRLDTIGLSTGITPFPWLRLEADWNHFDFGPLPAAVAYRSGITGNLNTGPEPATARFQYDFRGFTHNYLVGVRYSKNFSQTASIEIVDNMAAPENIRRSQRLQTGFKWKLTNFVIRPWFNTFFTESDSSPSFYTSPFTGFNNREGTEMGITVDFTKLGFSLTVDRAQARILQDRGGDQQDFEFMEVMFEVANIQF